jgi:isoleucyl-tRNA synthetase
MNIVRGLSSNGLEARTTAKINVRQSLAKLKVKAPLSLFTAPMSQQLLELVKDEVNVKEVVQDASIEKDVELDLNISAELKEEGTVRELIRAIQDLRKETGLTVNDKATLIIETDSIGKSFIEKNKAELVTATLLKEVKFETNTGKEIMVGEFKVKLAILK